MQARALVRTGSRVKPGRPKASRFRASFRGGTCAPRSAQFFPSLRVWLRVRAFVSVSTQSCRVFVSFLSSNASLGSAVLGHAQRTWVYLDVLGDIRVRSGLAAHPVLESAHWSETWHPLSTLMQCSSCVQVQFVPESTPDPLTLWSSVRVVVVHLPKNIYIIVMCSPVSQPQGLCCQLSLQKCAACRWITSSFSILQRRPANS